MAQESDNVEGLASVIQIIPQGEAPASAKDINAVIQLRSPGEAPGEWMVTISDGHITVEQGTAATPSVTVEAAPHVWTGLVQGKVNPAWAYMTGDIHVSGDLELALRLTQLITMR